ncbi:MAG: PaaI family thioesterase [Burkholderiaceae bacterium]
MKTPSLDATRAFYRASPFMVDLGIEPTQVREGRVHSELLLQSRHHQHTGQVHAGVTNAMADQAMGAAAQTLAPEGRWALTAELKTSHLRAAKGERLECEAWVVRGGRSLSFTEAEVYAVNGAQRTLVVKASATMALVEARA